MAFFLSAECFQKGVDAQEIMSRKKVSPERIIEELAAIGFAKATDYLTVENEELIIKPTEKLSRADRSAIASVERTSNGIRLKFYDKMKALELLGKHMGMFEGRDSQENQEQNNLLEAILKATQEELETDDLPEFKQTSDSDHDLVEPSGT